MPSVFQKILIKNLGKVITGKTPSTKNPENFSGEIMFITPVDLKRGYILESSDRYISEIGFKSVVNNTIDDVSVLVGCIGSDLGNISITKGKCATNQQINSITSFKPNYDPFYIYYWFCQKKQFLMNIAGNTTTPIVNKTDFENIYIDIPNIQTQKKISSVLSALDEKIVLNNKINEELEKIARDLYNYWFIQFDFPDENKRPYKSSGGKMVYNSVLKREIPEGWKVENLANNTLTKIIKPGIHNFNSEKVYLPTAVIENDKILDRKNIITYNNREGRANMQPVVNSVWFAKIKKTKKILYFGDYSTKRINEIIISTGMLGLECRYNSLEYIWNFVNNDTFESRKDRLSHGATQEALNNDDLLIFPILIPENKILQRYSDKVKALYEQKYKNELENEQLIELRDFLLPMLLNGQVLFN